MVGTQLFTSLPPPIWMPKVFSGCTDTVHVTWQQVVDQVTPSKLIN